MRRDVKIVLIERETSPYNPIEGGKTIRVKSSKEVTASVTDMSKDDQDFIFGKQTQQAYVVRINGREFTEYNALTIDTLEYTIHRSRVFRDKTVFWVVRV